MPRQKDQDIKPEARLTREEVNGDPYDVLYINDKEILAFHLKNIESLKVEHNNRTILEVVKQLLRED
jgi:hypothetical protein